MNQVLVDFVDATLVLAYRAHFVPGVNRDDLEDEVNYLVDLHQSGQDDPFYDLKVRIACSRVRVLVTG